MRQIKHDVTVIYTVIYAIYMRQIKHGVTVIYTIIYIYTNIHNFMYIVNTIATVAVEYRSQKRKREHHAKIDEHTNFMYTVNNKSEKTRASMARIYRVMPICQRVHPIVQDVALIVEGT